MKGVLSLVCSTNELQYVSHMRAAISVFPQQPPHQLPVLLRAQLHTVSPTVTTELHTETRFGMWLTRQPGLTQCSCHVATDLKLAGELSLL